MGIFDNAVPGGNITKPLMIALGALLVGKMLSGRNAEQTDEPCPAENARPHRHHRPSRRLAACSADWVGCSKN